MHRRWAELSDGLDRSRIVRAATAVVILDIGAI
jgi:hypothetical protein